MIPRTIFNEDHAAFRDSVRKFARSEIIPNLEQWDDQGTMDRDLWRKMGEMGLLCTSMPEEYGGFECDRVFSMVLLEELSPLGGLGLSVAMHSDIVGSYILRLASAEVKSEYLPKMATGEYVGALGMTEPNTGSDLKAIRTTAVRDGDHYVVNGAKTFITNGSQADAVVLAAKTDPAAGAKGVSLLLIDKDMPGFEKGKKLKKVGLKSQDTAELFFNDVRVPASNLLGAEGKGFYYMMEELAWERLQVGIAAVAAAQDAYIKTLNYVTERKAFDQLVADFQNTRFKLAEMKSDIDIAQVYLDRCMELELEHKLDPTDAAIVKYRMTDMQCRVVDECVQLHGGYGFMQEYPVARAWVDARAQRIYGGTNEIMKELIGRTLVKEHLLEKA